MDFYQPIIARAYTLEHILLEYTPSYDKGQLTFTHPGTCFCLLDYTAMQASTHYNYDHFEIMFGHKANYYYEYIGR